MTHTEEAALVAAQMKEAKVSALALLREFVAQRPGLEFADYGDIYYYRQDYNFILKSKHIAEEGMRVLALSFSPDDVQRALVHKLWNSSERLHLIDLKEGRYKLQYHVGQYFPTEYRRAAASIAYTALWLLVREMQEREAENKDDVTGDTIRAWFRRNTSKAFINWFDLK
jgi:hypothetical protein